MSAYCIFDVRKIFDHAKMEQYRASVLPLVSKFGGKYVAVGGPVVIVEGKPDIRFPVIIEFPNMARAKEWYESEEYKPLKKARENAAETSAYFVEGF